MHVEKDYTEHIEALARRAKAEKLETLAFLLQMALDYARSSRSPKRRGASVTGEHGKLPYAHPELRVLFHRSENDSQSA